MYTNSFATRFAAAGVSRPPVVVSLRQVWEVEQPSLRRNTRYVGRALLAHLADCFGREPLLDDMTPDTYRAFAGHLLQSLSVSSARTYLQRLRSLLNAATRAGCPPRCPMPPLAELLPPAPSAERTFLSSAELLALENTPCPHPSTKQAFLFSCLTGLRLSDIETLRWSDIRVINGNSIIVKRQVKTGNLIRIPLGDGALRLLDAHPVATDGPVFTLRSRAAIISDLDRWRTAAGIAKHVTFHVARHTFATLALLAGVDIYTVSKLCGHSSLKTTEIYAHMVDDTLIRGIDKMSALLRSAHAV